MPDYQRLIDNIRGILASSGSMPLDAVSAAAAEFSAACETVNDRLRQCGELLRAGLRSEAIQQCETEPNLLNLVATLDFSELTDWNSYLQAQGFLPEQPLLMDVAAELNEAYAVEQPLATLLRRHRLLAMGRAPLRDRVSTLRRLARLDGNNAVWQDDLRQYERARQQEIRQSAAVYSQRGDVAALEEACQDLQQAEWLESPDHALVEQVTSSYSRLVRQRALADLEQLEPQLTGAFSEFDVNRGRALREQWNASAALAGLSTDGALFQQAAPALEWLEEQDRNAQSDADYKHAVAELEEALDDGEGLLALDRLAHAALRFDRPLPAILEQRLRTRVASLELDRSRRVRLIVGAAALVIVLIGLGIGYGIYAHRQADEITVNVNTLRSLLDKKMFAEAEKHLDQLGASPAIASAPEIQPFRGELTKLKQAEQTRLAQFAEAIEKVEAAGSQNPDRASLAEAKRLASLDSEKARVVRLEGTIAAADRQRQKEIDEKFMARLNELTARAVELKENSIDEQALSSLRRDFNSLLRQDVPEAVRARSKILDARLESLQTTQKLRHDMSDALNSVTQSLGDPDGFKYALDAYSSKHPETTRAIDFKRVVSEIGAWKTIEAWNQFLDLWKEHPIEHLNGAAAKDLHAAGTKLLAEHGGYPLASGLGERLKYLESIKQREGGGEAPLHASLNTFFTDALIANLWMVEVEDPKLGIARYYLAAEPSDPKDGEVRFKYIVDFSRASVKPKTVSADAMQYNGTAPQSALAKMAMDELATLGDHAWDPTFLKMIRGVAAEERLEPILKVLFLQKILTVACEGSEVMKTSFARYQNTLNSVSIDGSVRWMDPSNQDARTARDAARALLKRLPDMRPIGEDIAKKLEALNAPLGEKHQWVGWLARGDNAGWICMSKDLTKTDGKLLVAIPDGDKGMHWTEIGQVKDAKCKLGPASPLSFVEGRPVWRVVSETAPPGTAHN